MVKPAEIGKIEFSTSFRGYNPDQVDDYIDNVVKYYTEAYNAGAELEKKCKELKARIRELELMLATDKTAEPEPEDTPIEIETIYEENASDSAEEKHIESDDDTIAHLVSELENIGEDGKPYEDSTDVSSLIKEISQILNAGIEEVEIKNEGSAENSSIITEDADYSNPFNQMFITDDIG